MPANPLFCGGRGPAGGRLGGSVNRWLGGVGSSDGVGRVQVVQAV